MMRVVTGPGDAALLAARGPLTESIEIQVDDRRSVQRQHLMEANLLYMLERVVGLSDKSYLRYEGQKAKVQTALDIKHKVEPCAGGIDQDGYGLDSANNCERIGKINVPPYVPRP